jgi:hypothetical protein
MLSKNVKIKIYKTIILPLVLYGYETWSLTLGEEHRLRVFEKRVLRRIFALKMDQMVGGRRKLHNKELHNLSFLPNINKRTKSKGGWAGHVAHMVEVEENAYRILV